MSRMAHRDSTDDGPNRRYWKYSGSPIGTSATFRDVRHESVVGGIVLQKSKVAGPQIFRENTEREAIADSYNLNRVTEVACEFTLRR